MKLRWTDFTLPPINLWTVPRAAHHTKTFPRGRWKEGKYVFL